jgi:acetolactate synthase I/II/III large subunit
MQLNGSQILIECLLEQGVDTVFGYPGGAILNVYDALYQNRDRIRHVLTSHEQGASHAADGYARSTGKTGVCFATSGPGATNLVTGIATAYMDSIPLVAITCNVGSALIGKDSFQEVDIAGIVMPITKYSFLIDKAEDIAPAIRKAFEIAQSGRKGPVLVDITKDATGNMADYEPKEPEERKNSEPAEEKINAFVEALQKAEKPYIFVGGGCVLSGASEEVRRLAELLDAPVCDTLMGKGVFPGEDERYTGMLGMHGTKTSNFGVSSCDLLLAVGVRFSDRVTGNTAKFANQARILQIDLDAAEVNKNVIVADSIVGDAKQVLSEINAKLSQQKHEAWMEEIREMKAKYPLQVPDTGLNGPFVVSEVYRQTKGDAIITTEVGQHQMWAAQYYKYKEPRMLLTSGGLGTMGYGLGASIGAQIGNPDKTVVNFAGDGCFRMNMNEIATAVREKLPLVEIIVNNHVLGMVRQWQTLFYGGRYSATVLDDGMDYVKMAEAMGAKAYRAENREEFSEALKKALAEKMPCVIDAIIDSDDKVWPMVAPGAPISEAFSEEDLNN